MHKFFLALLLIIASTQASIAKRVMPRKLPIPAAELYSTYAPLLSGKKIALVVNPTSTVGTQHLVDFLLEKKLNLVKIFGPEHGFRGKADAGEHLSNEVDAATKLPIVSLYGDHKKPTKADLAGVDVVLFDIQDVGVRFYTYISTLQYVMEACAEQKKKCIVLDRPNPNGQYVDGPVLKAENKSFVGMQCIPIVHGLTVGEYAKMLNGEKWLAKKMKCDLQVITMQNYTHSSTYQLPIPPSPNLRTSQSIMLYPSLCLFEGTEVSVGRGTDFPFEQWGHPSYTQYDYSFTPKPSEGAKDPLYKGQKCYGENLQDYYQERYQLELQWLIAAYKACADKKKFFNSFFTKLAGNTSLQKQIELGKSEEEIRATWKNDIEAYLKIRKKYLLYK